MDFNALIPELAVSDLSASLYFYQSILGFSLAYKREAEGFAFIELGHAQLMLDQIDKGRTWRTGDLAPPLGRGINFQIAVSDFHATLARVSAAGIALFLSVETATYEVDGEPVAQRQFCIQDPDGYLLRLVGTK